MLHLSAIEVVTHLKCKSLKQIRSVGVIFFLSSAISEDEKATLRHRLIANFNEPVNQVRQFNALTYSQKYMSILALKLQ